MKYFVFTSILLLLTSLLSGQENEALKKAMADQARLNEIEERLDTVEKKTLVDRIDLSMDVRMTLNNYIYRDRSSEQTKSAYGLLNGDGETFGAWNMRGRLKMKSMLGENFKLTAWISMYKQFIESAPGRYENKLVTPLYDMSRGYYPGNSSVYMERMYIDWFITKWLTLTVGRVSTVDGTPSDIRNNSVQLGTFFESQLNAPTDGLFATFDLSSLIKLKDSYLRIFYVPELHIDDNIPNNLFVQRAEGMQSTFGVVWVNGLPNTDGGQFTFNIGYMPMIKPGKVTADINSDSKEEELFSPNSMGTFLHLFAGFTAPKLMGSTFDVFATVAVTHETTLARTKDDMNNGFIGTPIENSGDISTPLMTLYGQGLDGASLTGYQLYAGLRYNTPLEMFGDSFKIGADFNYSSKYYLSYFVPDTTGLNRFAVRGLNAESYLIIPIHKKANIRLGYIYQHHDFPWLQVFPVGGGIPHIDETIHNINCMLNVYF